MKQIIKKGKTSYLALIYIEDSVTHLGKAGLINTSVTAAFARADQGNANATAISLSAGTRGTWSSGGFKEKDATAMPGWYELGIPDAALATGSDWVVVEFKDAGANGLAFPQKLDIDLVNYDPDDTVRLGLTALPNAAAEAAGGLFTRGTGAGQVNQAANGQLDANAATISAGAITASAIAAGAITASAIAANAITASAIATGAITAAKLAANALTASVFADSAIVASKVNADAVTKIAAGILSNTSNLLVTDSNGRVLMQGNVIKNQALSNFEFFMTDATDHVTGKTGLTVAVARSIDGGAFGASTNTPASEVASGVYKINLSAADLNGNVITFKFSAAGADTRVVTFVTNL